MRSTLIGFLQVALAVALVTAIAEPAQMNEPPDEHSYQRRYVEGEKYSYEVVTEGPEPDIAIADVEVRLDGSRPHEWIQWRSLESGSKDLSEAAKRMPGYSLSLLPDAPLPLVKPVDNPEMMGPVTDFYTFYFAVSHLAGSDQVKRIGETYLRPEPVVGDWSDGKDFLAGQSRERVSIKLVTLTPRLAGYETTFAPVGGTEFVASWMADPACDGQPNNFQMVKSQQPGYLAVWGCEHYSIHSDTDRRTGQILSAQMIDDLRWHLKFCQDRELQTCTPVPDLNQHRVVYLRLLRER